MNTTLLRFLLALVFCFITVCSKAVAQGLYILGEGEFLSTSNGDCGFIKGKWVPGKITTKGFAPFSVSIKKVKKSLKQAKGSKATALRKKLERLKKLNRRRTAACRKAAQQLEPAAVAVEATPAPTATAPETQSPTPTTTPSPSLTNTPTNTPTPAPSASPVATAVPTAGPTPTPLPLSPAPVINLFSVINGLSVFADDGTFLGIISTNNFMLDSISNSFGLHGSRFATDSIFNQFSSYGSPFSPLSSFSKFAINPPVIVDRNRIVAYLTTNAFVQGFPRVDTCDLAVFLGREADVISRCS